MKVLRVAVIAVYFVAATLPLVWLVMTSLKDRDDAISPHAKVIPSLSGVPGGPGVSFPATLKAYTELNRPVTGKNFSFLYFLANSAIIGLVSTLASVALGTACAYGFSRFRIAGARVNPSSRSVQLRARLAPDRFVNPTITHLVSQSAGPPRWERVAVQGGSLSAELSPYDVRIYEIARGGRP